MSPPRPSAVSPLSLYPDLQAAQKAAEDFVAAADTLRFFVSQSDMADKVASLVVVINERQPAHFSAIQAVVTELRNRRVQYGRIVAASAHEAAAQLEHAVVTAVWDALAPIELSQTETVGAESLFNPDSSYRTDHRRIVEHFDAVQKHFATMFWPDTNKIIADVQCEAANAAKERRRADPSQPQAVTTVTPPSARAHAGKSLPLSRAKAYSQYEWAIAQNPDLADKTDREVFDWLKTKEEMASDLPANADTFSTYLKMARRYHGTPKKTPRSGRAKGKSIVDQNQL